MTHDVRSRARRLRARLAKRALRAVFEQGQRLGVDITPRHFYSQIPDIRALRASDAWRRPSGMAGVAGRDVDAQLEWLRQTCTPEVVAALCGRDLWTEAGEANGAVGYGPVESELLYCLVRTRRPARILQIGAGASTWVARTAALDAGLPLQLRCVDPFPTAFLRGLAAEGAIDLRAEPVQAIDPGELVDELGPGDVFFVDSTHTVSPGSDVLHVVLEVLPRLRAGVLVHFHDITMPYTFSPFLLSSDLFFWSESVLLQAYLADNPRIAIRCGGAMLHEHRLAEAQSLLPAYEAALPTVRGIGAEEHGGAFPSAMWLEVTAEPAAAQAPAGPSPDRTA